MELVKFIKNNFEDSYLVKNFNTNFIFKLGPNIVVSDVFELLSKHREQLGIAQWGVINSSLEDVFMAVVERFDKEEGVREDMAASVILTNTKSSKNSNRSSVLIEEVNHNNSHNNEPPKRKESDDSSYIHNRDSVLSG